MIAFTALLYGVDMATLVIVGLGLYTGFPARPFAITVIPAIFAAVVIAVFLAVSLLPGDFEPLVARYTDADHRRGRIARRMATAPAPAATGMRTAISLVRSRDRYLFGAIRLVGV